jgi:hypothetical protein
LANALVERIPGGLTKQAVSLWETGQQKPSLYFLITLTLAYDDWRKAMALECLSVVRPRAIAVSELLGPADAIPVPVVYVESGEEEK